jgi:beta-galactosidase
MNNKDVLFPVVYHGGDYNPEQWPEAVWADDVRLMNEAHVNIATVPVFGWVALQPDEDTFCFEWLDRVLDTLHDGGVAACVATATASVPAWVDQKYPDVLTVGIDGRKRKHGGRHVFCPHSANFRRLSTGLVRRLAERYKDHPALKVWHVSNEYGNHCYCDSCAAAFRVWLDDRYGSLAEVNRRWNTSFWGHTFTDWSQIETPTSNGERSVQGLLIDYDRFQSWSLLQCFKAEAAVLREIAPGIPITTNLMGPFKGLDYHEWAKEMDIVSWDSYPRRGADPASIAFNHDLMRGLKDGGPSFMLMEQTPSQQNWQAYNSLKRPGIMRLWSYQAMAHGADTVMYFQWRRSRGGCEKYHGAVVEHVGTSEPRVFREVAQLGRELSALGNHTLGGKSPSKVAILFDWNNWWAVEYSSGPSVDLKYVQQCQAWHTALHSLGIETDVVSPSTDLSGYRVVIAPLLYMVKPGVAKSLEAFTAAGGTFMTTFFSGIVDDADLVTLEGYPGELRKLVGVWAEEIDVLSPAESNTVVFDTAFGDLKGSYSCGMLCDLVHLETAESLAVYGEDFYAGMPALTVNRFGAGKAYYVATSVGNDVMASALHAICEEQGVEPALPDRIPVGLEAVRRVTSDGQSLLYLLNHATATLSGRLPEGRYADLLTGRELSNQFEIEPRGVQILRKLGK